MENKTKSRENQSHHILHVQKFNQGRACFIFTWRPPFILSSHKSPRYHFRQQDDFCKRLRGHFRPLHPKISSLEDIDQQKMGTNPHNHFTDLQTVCKTNIRIWDCFYNNSFGHCHQQPSRSSKLFHQASTSSSKICLSPLIT